MSVVKRLIYRAQRARQNVGPSLVDYSWECLLVPAAVNHLNESIYRNKNDFFVMCYMSPLPDYMPYGMCYMSPLPD